MMSHDCNNNLFSFFHSYYNPPLLCLLFNAIVLLLFCECLLLSPCFKRDFNSICPCRKKIILLIPSIFSLPLCHCASIYNPPLIYYILFHLINTLISSIKLTNHNSSITMAHILTLTNEILLGPHDFISHRESSSSPSSIDDFEA